MPVMAIPRKTSREVRRLAGFELSMGMKDRGAGENIILEVGLKVI
jgi:hypothetical protein